MHLITILLFIILVSLSHHVLSQDSFSLNTSVIPIYKDAKTSLHKVSWSIQPYTYQPYYLINLDAPFTWTDCVVRPPPMDYGLEFACTWPLRCDDTLCKEAHSYVNPTCPSLVNITAKYGSNMGSKRSKEDDVSKISTSVFITNFPESFNAKDLWNVCKQYRNIIDAYIPNRRSKAGKRFGFVRFIKIFDEKRLINNLCTIWVGRLKIHANIPRFQRMSLNTGSTKSKNNLRENSFNKGENHNNKGSNNASNSYAHAVKVGPKSVQAEVDNIPALVLDEDCLNQQEYSNSLLGKVMIEFQLEETKKKFTASVGVGVWFSQLQQASKEFTLDGRVTWVEIEGVPLKMWSENTFNRIASKWGTLLHVDDQDDGCFHRRRVCINTTIEEGSVGQNDSRSKDPFHIYDLLNKKQCDNNKELNSYDSLKYPSGFTPIGTTEAHSNKCAESKQEGDDDSHSNKEEEGNIRVKKQCLYKNSKEDIEESFCSGLTQKAKKDWVKELCMYNKVNVLSLQETKMETIESISIKMCWGNFAFDFVYSASVGNSGGILCVWDPRCFHKSNATISDYFIIIRGVWVPKGKNLLIIAVYAPQELLEKKMLWDYLTLVIANWKGEVVMMGDFNEVRKKEERFGSNFNVLGADAFNFFYLECEFGGAITLDRYLSDHRPILLRESKFDYGPIPFRFFNYWFEVEGFDKFVEETWTEAPVDNKITFKEELAELDAVIDKGEGNEDVVNKRMKVVNSLQELDKLQALEAAQKVKIKWAIEGDENSKYYHGILNKKRNQLTIRGVLVDGIWIESPSLVKKDIVNKVQSAFVVDRQILDGPFILNELVQLCKSKKKQSLIFKVDFEKAYDSVRWDYLDDIMKKFGFGERWCGWIQSCLRSSKGTGSGRSESNIDTIVHVLDCFYKASGLRFNMNKSKLMGIYVDGDIVDQAALKVECVTLKSPFSYLGSKLGGLMSRIHSWNETVDCMVDRLSKWKMKTLSIGASDGSAVASDISAVTAGVEHELSSGLREMSSQVGKMGSFSRNNMVYFIAILRDGLFEIDLSNSYANDSSIYIVSNKRAKLDLDSALLWHCRLGHISKKRIEKLQHEELLNSTDLRAFEKCISCMSRKMARKPYTHQVERAKDLLRLIHTDVCDFKIMSRHGQATIRHFH
ncbi:RNA-directed DNA polymerase, eukaryota [Tanacetum coccineum]